MDNVEEQIIEDCSSLLGVHVGKLLMLDQLQRE